MHIAFDITVQHKAGGGALDLLVAVQIGRHGWSSLEVLEIELPTAVPKYVHPLPRPGKLLFLGRMDLGAYLVGVAGGSGSGKTTLVRALRDSLPNGSVCLVSQDDYYLPKEEQSVDPNGRINFDLPTSVDLDGLAGDLRRLSAGEPIYRREYTFNQEGRESRMIEVHPAPVILVEGLFLLHHVAVRSLFHLRVFVEASERAQLERRLRRDAMERGYGREDVMYQWEHHVLPAYRNYLLPYRGLCELHVKNEESVHDAVHQLREQVVRTAGLADPIPAQVL